MNSKQPARYIKRRMGNDLKKQILIRDGIMTEDSAKQRPHVLNCPRCELANASENKVCSKCAYPLGPEAYEEIKARENAHIQGLRDDVSGLKAENEVLRDSVKDMQEILKNPKKLLEIAQANHQAK